MNNRPHSRKKRVSDNESFVNKQSFSSGPSFSTRNNSRRSFRPSFSYAPRIRMGSGLSRIIVLTFIAFLVINSVRYLFSSFSVSNNQISENENNTYIENHDVSHNANTSSDDVDYSISSGTRKKYTNIIGNNKDEVTVMVYMIGSDLESNYGAATADINEMAYSGLNDNINLILETGGSRRWNNSYVSSRKLERYTITSNGPYPLDTKIENKPMTDPQTLSSFISYTADNFPANRYILILWDHGGGSVTGYGLDENYPYEPSMSPDVIAKALKDGGVKFDVVGFDACLMANLETAIAIEPYADYMIASEETEPGGGWYYSDFIKELDDNRSIPTIDLAKQIIDDYVVHSLKDSRTSELTLSCIDLGELVHNISSPITKFSKAVSSKLSSDKYQEIATARGNTKEFSKSSRLDQIDLIDLALKFNVDGSKEVVDAIKSSVKYNKTANIHDAYGLSAYFPYSSLSKMNEMVEIYDNIDIDEEYANVVKSFASYASSGQIVTNSYGTSNTSIFDILMGDYYPSTSYSTNDIYDVLYDSYNSPYSYNSYSNIFGSGYDDWFDYSLIDYMSSYFGRGKIVDTNELKVVEKNGENVVSLSESQWELIDNVLLNVYVDDGSGYIEMGKDNVFDFNEDGDLIVDYDGTWLAIDDHFIPYYMVSDVYVDEYDYKTTGKVPAYLNGQRVDIMISFTPDNPYGKVEGAKFIYSDSDVERKGLIKIKNGDVIDFICNYYKYDGTFESEYRLGDRYIVNGDMELYNVHIKNDYLYTYCFNDVYGNSLLTPVSNKY